MEARQPKSLAVAAGNKNRQDVMPYRCHFLQARNWELAVRNVRCFICKYLAQISNNQEECCMLKLVQLNILQFTCIWGLWLIGR